jgi:hypothetical protein
MKSIPIKTLIRSKYPTPIPMSEQITPSINSIPLNMIFPPQLVQIIKVGESLFPERIYDEKELQFQ